MVPLSWHVVERGGAVEVGRRRELDMARHDRHRAADRVADTLVMVSVWPASLAGPLESLPVSAAKVMVRVPLSSATLDSASSVATGASLTSVTVKVTWPVSVLGSASAIGGAVVLDRVVERGGAVEVGRRRELDVGAATIATVPPTALLTPVMVSVWPASLAGPFEVVAGQRRKGDAADAAVLGDAGQRVVGGHRRVVDLGDVKVTWPVSVLGSATPLVVPLS